VFDCCSRLVRQSFDSASTIVRQGFEKPSTTLRENAEAQPSNSRTIALPYSNQSQVVDGRATLHPLTGHSWRWLRNFVVPRFGLGLDLVVPWFGWNRSSANRGGSELALSSEADPKQTPVASLSDPSAIPLLFVYAFLPLCSRLPFAKVPLFGLFTEVYAGHMGMGPEGRVTEGGLRHGIAPAFDRSAPLTPAFFLPLFCRNLTRMYVSSMP